MPIFSVGRIQKDQFAAVGKLFDAAPPDQLSFPFPKR